MRNICTYVHVLVVNHGCRREERTSLGWRGVGRIVKSVCATLYAINNGSYGNEFEFEFDQFSKVESNGVNSKFSLLYSISNKPITSNSISIFFSSKQSLS